MTGFAQFAFKYAEEGWTPLPLPHREKELPPTGYTGFTGVRPSGADLQAWSEGNPNGNICLHLRDRLVGIDVDAYGIKSGEATFNEAMRRWGPLPPTVISTSRTDWVSGIRIYRLPADLPEEYELETIIKFPELGISNIEILQKKHRYAVVYPSIHPDTKMEYRWYNSDWEQLDRIPSLEDIPELPPPWVEGLTSRASAKITEHGDPDSFISNLPQGPMSKTVMDGLHQAMKDLDTEPGSRHDATVKSVLRLLRMADDGETGVSEALRVLGTHFVEATRDRNTEDEARLEYRRMVYGTRGHDLIASSPSAKKVEREMTEGLESVIRSTPPVTALDMDMISVLEKELGAREVGTEDAYVPLNEMEWFLEHGDKPMPQQASQIQQQPSEPTTDDRSGIPFKERLYTIDGLRTIPPAAPLIDGLLYRNTLAQISGAPGSYKSFLVLAMAMAVASPLEKWEGYPVNHHGPVIYVAAEGLSGMRVRAEAWCQANNCSPDQVNILFFPDEFDIESYSDVEQVLDMVRTIQPVLLVIDTRARVTGALDENSATEQGKAIAKFEQIRKSVRCTVLAVHHSSKSGTAGRGSNAWDGAVWTELRSSSEAERTMSVKIEKHKDAPSGTEKHFDMNVVKVDESRMPEFTKERDRITLVAVGHDERGLPEDRTPDKKAADVEEIAKFLADHCGPEGMSHSEIIRTLDGKLGVEKTVRRKIQRAVKSGAVKKVGTENRPRYAVSDVDTHL